MATQADVRRIAMSMAGAQEERGRFAFSVENKGKLKGFVWVWLERVDPKKARVPNPTVIAVRVANLAEKAQLLSADSRKFFTEPHYEGYPAVLVRLEEVTAADLRILIEDAWRCQAPTEQSKRPGAKGQERKAKSRRPRAQKPTAHRMKRQTLKRPGK